MRFFNDDFYWQLFSTESDFEQVLPAWEAVKRAYLEHLRHLNALPETVRAIAKPYTVDDCLLSMARVNLMKKSLMLCLRCGNTPDGYFDLTLHYRGVYFTDELIESLRQIAELTTLTRFSHDGWIHEFDAGLDWVSHEIAFHYHPWPPEVEESGPIRLSILCGSIAARTEPRKNRRLAPMNKRFRMAC
jgi:hypothetical protein